MYETEYEPAHEGGRVPQLAGPLQSALPGAQCEKAVQQPGVVQPQGPCSGSKTAWQSGRSLQVVGSSWSHEGGQGGGEQVTIGSAALLQ
jgi:hypothetical protein